MSDDCRFNDNDWCVVHGTPLNRGRRSNYCSLKSELSLNEFQRQMHTYKSSHHECHALGIVGELAEVSEELAAFRAAGHVADIVKKAVSHGVHANRAVLLKELGDVLWYVGAVARDNDISLQEVAQANIEKLRARYPNGFEKGGGVRSMESLADSLGLINRSVENITDDHGSPLEEIPVRKITDISLVGGVPTRTSGVYFHCGCSEVNGRKTRCADAKCQRLL